MWIIPSNAGNEMVHHSLTDHIAKYKRKNYSDNIDVNS